ncbi:hypothetical protein [Nostoc sp. NIES-3756]|nr:hypothetical protein [Nostoc sp. NIES-3756]
MKIFSYFLALGKKTLIFQRLQQERSLLLRPSKEVALYWFLKSL